MSVKSVVYVVGVIEKVMRLGMVVVWLVDWNFMCGGGVWQLNMYV